MEINEYKKADCRLFRSPSIDISPLSKAIEEAFLKAWENGNSASNVLSSLSSSGSVIDALKDQISTHLNYQKAVYMQRVESEAQSRISAYDQEKQAKLSAIEQTIGAETAKKKEELEKTESEIKEKQNIYSASQAKLEEMRNRIKDRIKLFGGKKKLETIIAMKDTLKATQTNYFNEHSAFNKGEDYSKIIKEAQEPEKPKKEHENVFTKIFGVFKHKK